MQRSSPEAVEQRQAPTPSQAQPSGGPAAANNPADARPAPVQQAAQLMGRRLKVRAKDGRVLEGDFYCLDKLGNIILNNTYQLSDSSGGGKEQEMGPVLIPRCQQSSCHLLVMPGEKAETEKLLVAAQQLC